MVRYKVKIGYRKGLADSFRGHLGRKGHQYKVDMAKSNKERGNHAAQQEIESNKIKICLEVWKIQNLKRVALA